MKTAKVEVLPAVLVDPAEFGLDAEKAAEVESVFLPVVTERDLLAENYAVITSQEITPKTTQQARDLRLKLVKLRTNTDRIHKAAKAFYLAGGRFVDAWKNKNVVVIEQMEEKLEDIELHFVRIEQQRILDLQEERKGLLWEYSEVLPEGLGLMPQAVFDAYLTGLKVAHEAKLAEEKRLEDERIEQERILKLHRERKESILRLWQYVDPEIEFQNFGAMSDAQWSDVQSVLTGRKKKQDDENERIRVDNEAKRIENERLQKEAEKKAKELEAERKKQAQILADQQAKAEQERKAIEEKARIAAEKAEAELAKQKAEADREAKKKEDEARNERLIAEAERQKLQAEIQAQKDAEARLKAEAYAVEVDRLAQEEAAKKAPKKNRLTQWVSDMSISLPLGIEQDDTVLLVAGKFEAFKVWATKEIEKL